MKTFHVEVDEIYNCTYEVKAESKEEARQKFKDGDAKLIHRDFEDFAGSTHVEEAEE